MKFVQPKSPSDLEQYFEFRWRILRAPLGMPRGSEQDDLENVSFHLMVKTDEDEIVGVAKFKPYSDTAVQISHVAVAETSRGGGIGCRMLEFLEREAKARNFAEVFLTAREHNIPYFAKFGYALGAEAESPLPDIKIFKMHKTLT